MQVELDGRLMTSREEAHDHIAERLAFPSYYGRNLDALYDLLVERRGLEIILVNGSYMKACLGGYAEALQKTIQDAVKENAFLSFSMVSEINENYT